MFRMYNPPAEWYIRYGEIWLQKARYAKKEKSGWLEMNACMVIATQHHLTSKACNACFTVQYPIQQKKCGANLFIVHTNERYIYSQVRPTNMYVLFNLNTSK